MFISYTYSVTYTHKLTYKKYRILYTILEYDPLLDSSNMGMEDWAKIGKDVEKYYRQFHAFVVLHGTDTMAYTASALSFMLEDLGKTVIVTGSQVCVCVCVCVCVWVCVCVCVCVCVWMCGACVCWWLVMIKGGEGERSVLHVC